MYKCTYLQTCHGTTDKGYRKIQATFKIITPGSGPTWVGRDTSFCPLEMEKALGVQKCGLSLGVSRRRPRGLSVLPLDLLLLRLHASIRGPGPHDRSGGSSAPRPHAPAWPQRPGPMSTAVPLATSSPDSAQAGKYK